jgi:hypothetical protein
MKTTETAPQRTIEERAHDLFRVFGAVQLDDYDDDGEPVDETIEERADRCAINYEIRRLSLRHIRAANSGDLDE